MSGTRVVQSKCHLVGTMYEVTSRVLGIRRTAHEESVGRGRKEYEASPLTIGPVIV